MSRTTRHFEVSDALYAALETMSREMHVDHDALVNQALFVFARMHGFVVPTVVPLDVGASPTAQAQPKVEAPRVELPKPQPAVAPTETATAPEVKTEPAAPRADVSQTPIPKVEAKTETPEPVKADAELTRGRAVPPPPPVPAPETPKAPELDEAALRVEALARMADIAKDVDAWVVPVEPPVEEDEEDEDEDEEAQGEGEEASAGEQEGAADESDGDDEDGARDEGDDEAPNDEAANDEASAPAPAPEDSAPRDAPGDSSRTIVVRSAAGIRVWLRANDGDEIEVPRGRFVIGRGVKCDLRIDSPRVSREHAAVLILDGEVLLQDLGSSNGTWYDGNKVERRNMVDGDTVLLGNEKIRFRIEA